MVSQSPDTKITTEAPVRAPSSVPVDDAVLPFEVAALDLRGRLTRLGPALDDILTKHDYPAPVGKLLGEAIVLATLLGSALKFDGRFILQTQTDGPVSFLIVDFQSPDRLRAYARCRCRAPRRDRLRYARRAGRAGARGARRRRAARAAPLGGVLHRGAGARGAPRRVPRLHRLRDDGRAHQRRTRTASGAPRSSTRPGGWR